MIRACAASATAASVVRGLRVLFVDNFDSFTYNLVEEFLCMGAVVQVVRNDISAADLDAFVRQNDMVVLSPGPGTADEAGICVPLIRRYRGSKPILGICLGHQAIVRAYGGEVAAASLPVHGKVSALRHKGEYCFAGLPDPLSIGRYHSLVATNIPAPLICIATVDGLIMSVIDPQAAVIGFQFHPESILTPQGSALLQRTVCHLLQRSGAHGPEHPTATPALFSAQQTNRSHLC